MQLTDQVQRINTKLQASLTTLSQPSPSAAALTADANGAASSNGDAAAAARGKIDKMSAEVVDSNPYSRLMALQRMGIVQDYEKIRDKTVSGGCVLTGQAVWSCAVLYYVSTMQGASGRGRGALID